MFESIMRPLDPLVCGLRMTCRKNSRESFTMIVMSSVLRDSETPKTGVHHPDYQSNDPFYHPPLYVCGGKIQFLLLLYPFFVERSVDGYSKLQ